MRRASRLQPAGLALPEPAAARRAFDAAAVTFDAACAAHDHARENLLGRLAWLNPAPKIIIDAGCGTGRGCAALTERYPGALTLGIDISPAMLTAALRLQSAAVFARCDVQALPFVDHSVDLLLVNLVLPWCDPSALLRECARVLSVEGLLLLSTTGPTTLQELRRAWRGIDEDVHVHANFDMQTLGDLIVQAGLREPVLDCDRLVLRYSTPARLHEELRATGAGNCAPGRRRSLTGTDRFRRYERALAQEAGSPAGIDVTLEIIYAQAWGRAQRDAQASPAPRFRGIALRSE
ncbi:MAG: methyltransferase domain-containing protein [Gammaproteobacteria bacterium]|jgi:malonyl-CoA O-methyltransferase